MPLDLALLKKALKDVEDSEAVLENVLNSIEEEKEKGIESKRKADREAKNLRTAKINLENALKEVGYNPDEHDPLEFLSDLKEAKEKVASGDVTNKSELAKVMKQLSDLQKKFEEKDKEANELKDRTRKGTIKDHLAKAIGEKVYGSQFVINNLINDGVVGLNDNDEVVFIDGDDEVEFDKGIKTFLEKNPDIVRNSQRPGGGSSGGGPSKAKFSSSDLDGMSVQEIIANKDEVLSSLKAAN